MLEFVIVRMDGGNLTTQKYGQIWIRYNTSLDFVNVCICISHFRETFSLIQCPQGGPSVILFFFSLSVVMATRILHRIKITSSARGPPKDHSCEVLDFHLVD